MIAFAAAWTAGCAALAAFLAVTGLPVWLAIITAWTGPAAAAGVLLWAYGEISERRQASDNALDLQLQQAADDIDRALTILCNPCHGRPGRCTCNSRLLCDNDDCPAPDTTVLTGADVAWLRSISVAEGES